MDDAAVAKFNKLLEDFSQIPDEKKLLVLNGVRYPGIVQAETIELLSEFAARPDDVLLVTYPKCGCNWVLRLLRHMMKIADPTMDVSNEHNPHMQLLEFGPPEKMKVLDATPSPRLLATHLSDLIPKGFFQNGTKIVLIFREPKDTAVSFYHFYRNNLGLPTIEPWQKFFRMFMEGEMVWGSYFDHAKFWSKRWEDKSILILTYEELKADLRGQVQKMSTFLGLGLSEEQITAVATGGTFSAMKAKADAENIKFGKAVFRKGEVGDWKNHFDEEQRAELEGKFAEALAGTSLARRLDYVTSEDKSS